MREARPAAAASLSTCLVAGGLAGTAVDLILFPLDTLKTRLQSVGGLAASGGLRGMYSGISSTLVGSAPGAALFFLTYETLKQAFSALTPGQPGSPWVHLAASSLSEVSACTVRVPIEVLKQRMQVLQYKKGLWDGVQLVYRSDGVLGFYRGFQATLQREIPFACIQFPLYEQFKAAWLRYQHTEDRPLAPWKAAICGSAAGAITALLTNPLDVLKTRTMLSDKDGLKNYHKGPLSALRDIVSTGGLRQLFAGATARTLGITLGGFIFFGVYEKAKKTLEAGRTYPRHSV